MPTECKHMVEVLPQKGKHKLQVNVLLQESPNKGKLVIIKVKSMPTRMMWQVSMPAEKPTWPPKNQSGSITVTTVNHAPLPRFYSPI